MCIMLFLACVSRLIPLSCSHLRDIQTTQHRAGPRDTDHSYKPLRMRCQPGGIKSYATIEKHENQLWLLLYVCVRLLQEL